MQSLNVNSENIYMPLHVPIKQKNIILVVLSKKDQPGSFKAALLQVLVKSYFSILIVYIAFEMRF